MARSTMNELMRVATTFQQMSSKSLVIEPQDSANSKVALRIDMGNGIKLGLGYYTKLEAVKVLKALTMYVDSTKPIVPPTYVIPEPAAVSNLFGASFKL